jgi:hypothetical protein
LFEPVKVGQVACERIEKTFLYVSSEPAKANKQINRQRAVETESVREVVVVSDTTVIESLIEAIHAGRVAVSPSLITKRLFDRGVPIATKQVEQVFKQYGIPLEKKHYNQS